MQALVELEAQLTDPALERQRTEHAQLLTYGLSIDLVIVV